MTCAGDLWNPGDDPSFQIFQFGKVNSTSGSEPGFFIKKFALRFFAFHHETFPTDHGGCQWCPVAVGAGCGTAEGMHGHREIVCH